MAKGRGKTSDGEEILRRRFVEGDAMMEARVRLERDNLNVAQQLYDLRSRADLTQQELAERVGTTASVICRLEDADYEGHSLNMLRRVAAALNCGVEVRLIPVGESVERPAAKVTQRAQGSARLNKPPRYHL